MRQTLIIFGVLVFLISFKGNSQNKQKEKMISLEQIKEMYDSMNGNGVTTDQHLLYGYFFTNTEPKSLEKVAAHLKKDKFDYVDIYQEENGAYWLHMERIETHNAKSLFKLNKKLYAVANKYHVSSYDGFDIGNPDKSKPIERDTYVVPEEFGATELMIENLPKLVLANKAFERFPHKEEFSYFVVVKTKYTIENAAKLPSEKELEVLNDFEVFIERSLTQSKISNYYIGRTTYNEQRIFLLVTNEKDSVTELMDIMKRIRFKRAFEYKIVEDKEWKLYSELMSVLN